ncbi:MAG: 4-hydroxythreonine-4-phosphate dehydrogenase PdxA [Candidatus Omnitrophica bacterium]|nr:4-hydroxythreonine-4-phosphate dehydrogenase PdxA [Candidatus Omnitrophota bacterium]
MTARNTPVTLAITAGDPCGVGPEVILKALTTDAVRRTRLVVIGDLAVFERTAARLHRRLPRWRVVPRGGMDRARGHALTFVECGSSRRFVPGRSSSHAGRAALTYLEEAIRLWRAGTIHGLVTAPVTKWAVAAVEPSFVGHTEYLARAMAAREVVMMFVSDAMRVVLLTRHIPLHRVGRAVTSTLLERSVRLTASALTTQFHIRQPTLAVCGINPHAGEEGRCGREEQAVMIPALRRLRRQGIRCDGPFAADGFFTHATRYDAIICSYHDQGLIPFKMAARDQGCQVSLGLPIVRTSPDHGSALDIAGRGIANPGSMRYALRLATKLAARL